jgi:hypothetical protein
MVEIRLSPTKENVSLTDGRDQGQDGRQPKKMYHLRMVENKARMIEIRPGWSPTKENVSLTDGRDQGQDGRQPKRMYHLRMIEIKAKMVVNQRECITYRW